MLYSHVTSYNFHPIFLWVVKMFDGSWQDSDKDLMNDKEWNGV